MQQVKIWVDKLALARMVDKVMARLEDPAHSFPKYAGVNRGNCVDFIMGELKNSVESYGLKPDANLDKEYQYYDFSRLLNDTIFVLTATYYPEFDNPATAVCNMKHNAGTNDSFQVEFYLNF